MSEVTEEELKQIANNFLLNSPPGEFMEVVTDVRALLPNEQLLNSTAGETFREYNTEQMVQVNSPNHRHQVLITKHGEVADGEYLDPRGNQIILYDHIRQEVTGARSADLDSDVEPFRSTFDDEAVKYVSEHYPHGTATVYGKRQGNQYKVIVCISSSKFNPSNYWNGRWRSTWQVTFGAGGGGGGQATIDGKIQVNVHYYEDGNVQLNTNTEKHLAAPTGDPAATATNAMKAIIKAEQAFHSSLDTSYTTMGDTTFKALRRALPITRQRIDWNKIRSLKIGSELANK